MFATHDLGKLDRRWQAWAHKWQERVSELRRDDTLCIEADYMAAHTSYDSSDKAEWKANQAIRPKRPHHAAESARAGRDLIRAVAGTCLAPAALDVEGKPARLVAADLGFGGGGEQLADVVEHAGVGRRV